MAGRKKVTAVSLCPRTLGLLRSYVELRGGVSRSSAIEELVDFLVDPSKCDTNPARIQEALDRLRTLQRSSCLP